MKGYDARLTVGLKMADGEQLREVEAFMLARGWEWVATDRRGEMDVPTGYRKVRETDAPHRVAWDSSLLKDKNGSAAYDCHLLLKLVDGMDGVVVAMSPRAKLFGRNPREE